MSKEPSYQYGNLKVYSSAGCKRPYVASVEKIIKEAARLAGYYDHLQKNGFVPGAPELLEGMELLELLKFHDEAVARIAKRRGKGNGFRKDSPTLANAVFSFPYRPDQANDPAYLAFRNETIEWFRAQIVALGGEIKSIVQHTDEGWCHIHVFAMNMNDPKLSAKKLHWGEIAAAKAKKETGKPGIVEYSKAMSAWQDSYETVSIRHGCEKLGPGRRKLSTKDWALEKAERLRRAERLSAIESGEADLVEREQKLQAAAEVVKARGLAAMAEAKEEKAQWTAKLHGLEIGMQAWCADQIDDAAWPVADLPAERFATLSAAIAPVRGILVNWITPHARTLARLSAAAAAEIKALWGQDYKDLARAEVEKNRPGR